MSKKFFKYSLIPTEQGINFIESDIEIYKVVQNYNQNPSDGKNLYLSNIEKKLLQIILEIDSEKDRNPDLRSIRKFMQQLKDRIGEKYLKKGSNFIRCAKIQELNSEQIQYFLQEPNYRYSIIGEYTRTIGASKEQSLDKGGLDGSTKCLDHEDTGYELTESESMMPLEKELQRIDAVIDSITYRAQGHPKAQCPYYLLNTLIVGESGTGKSKIARMIYKKLLFNNLIEEEDYLILGWEKLQQFNGIGNLLEKKKRGIVLIENFDRLQKASNINGDNRFLDAFIVDMERYRNQFIFVLSGEKEDIKELVEKSSFDQHIKFFIEMPRYSDEELFAVANEIGVKEGYTIDHDAIDNFIEKLNEERENKTFQNIYTVKKVVENAIVNKSTEKKDILPERNDLMVIRKEHFQTASPLGNLFAKNKVEVKGVPVVEVDPLAELHEMIGLQEVKEKIRDITNYIKVQKLRRDMGIKSEPMCLHMEFTGAPGTGKTTVARIVGKIFKEIGVLETGSFTEVTREDLVGQFIGHTAKKTAQVIERAWGGVLFIDESYSLYSESNKDYGYEAVTTLVKKMEDKRDNLVVILAGYEQEMNLLRGMNPGLADRIQYRIHFPDYSPNELTAVFLKFCVDHDYFVEDCARKEILRLFERIYHNRDENFSNARLVRKCFERIKVYQSRRVLKKDQPSKADIMTIGVDDVKYLYYDENISRMLTNRKKRAVGFL